VLLIATWHRLGDKADASSLYCKIIERLNCAQNQVTIRNQVLIRSKVAAFIITRGQDNIQAGGTRRPQSQHPARGARGDHRMSEERSWLKSDSLRMRWSRLRAV